jgi:hypothetical protein
VQDHTGAVQNAGQRAGGVSRQTLRRGGDDRLAGGIAVTGEKRRALLVERRNDVCLDRLRPENGNEPRNARFVEYAVDGRGPAAFRRRRDAWKSST